jgi:carboxymethylenebutenolidase
MHSQTELRVGDATCRVEHFDGGGPGVLMFHDGLGMRPAMHEVAASIATAGYRVMMPDLFYRMAPYDAPDPHELFSDPAVMAAWWAKAQSNTAEMILSDLPVYLAELRARVQGPFGATGYCMGGRLALCAAALHPAEFAAVAAYHPGRLVTDTDSPHQLFGTIEASVYIGAATDDATFSLEHQQIVKQALAGKDLTFEVYPAKHGWVPTDTPVHDTACARRHLETLLQLLGRRLS